MQKTPLNATHQALGAQLVPFGGWEMPVCYRDIVTEHRAVREAAGLFDLCHMGRIRFRGPGADDLAGRVQTSDVRSLKVGRTRYALICTEEGGILDDILISREEGGLLLVVNAGNRPADLECFHGHTGGLDVEIVDDSTRLAMVAIQGPTSAAVMEGLGLSPALALRYYRLMSLDSPFGQLVLSRTGYTGEDGFEVILPAEAAAPFWAAALEKGAPHGLIPCGLGARDTLRLEAGMPLHGHEIDTTVNPYEAGLDFAVRSPLAFVGSDSLQRIREAGPARALVGLRVDGPRIPRQGNDILIAGEAVGQVCSGTRSPTLEANIATALVDSEAVNREGSWTVAIRKHEASAQRTPLPFYRRKEQ